jgi:hypothetical protein
MARVKLDEAGVAELLESAGMKAAVKAAAEQIADNVRAQGITVGDREGGPREQPLPVKVTLTETDRAHANVTLAHPAGQAVQAKHGALTKAAAQAGLDVRSAK